MATYQVLVTRATIIDAKTEEEAERIGQETICRQAGEAFSFKNTSGFFDNVITKVLVADKGSK